MPGITGSTNTDITGTGVLTATPRLKSIQRGALAMLVVAGAVNYIDRATLAVANPLIRQELGLSIPEMGYLLSAFLWSYAFAQLPTGAMVDKLGPRRLLTAGLSLWSVAQLLGGPVAAKADLAKAASPVTYADAGDPPTLILHGDQDRTVPLTQSQELESALTRAGVDATLVVLPGAGHGGPAFGAPATRATVVAFLTRVLAPRGG